MAVGTTALVVGGLAAAATAGGSIYSANQAKKGAKAQANSADAAAQLQYQAHQDGLDLLRPQYEAGDIAREALMYELGIGSKPTVGGQYSVGDRTFSSRNAAESFLSSQGGPDPLEVNDRYFSTLDSALSYLPQSERDGGVYQIADVDFNSLEEAEEYLRGLGETQGVVEDLSNAREYAGFQETPGYQFQLDESQRAIERAAAARGQTLSGATLKALDRNAQGIASQEYGNYMNRLAGVAGAGQTAATNAFAGYQSLGQGQANLALQAGNARASGYQAQGEGVQGALGGLASGLGFIGSGIGGGFGGGFEGRLSSLLN